ncbi:hypothetical protein K0M31_009752 [Melipona bicolor]|uniref:Uncharacterized protein n=1 Tax=Melipona bicolor TaxID=60889 RepID=A0AA40FN51_9HYME|nr:hypothetical protein K0M31_009752 [Melipona bicolor]
MGVINTTSTPTSRGSNKDGPGRTRKVRFSGKDPLRRASFPTKVDSQPREVNE